MLLTTPVSEVVTGTGRGGDRGMLLPSMKPFQIPKRNETLYSIFLDTNATNHAVVTTQT